MGCTAAFGVMGWGRSAHRSRIVRSFTVTHAATRGAFPLLVSTFLRHDGWTPSVGEKGGA